MSGSGQTSAAVGRSVGAILRSSGDSMNAQTDKHVPVLQGRSVEELLEEWRRQDAAQRGSLPLPPVRTSGRRSREGAAPLLPSIIRKIKDRLRVA